MQSPKLIWAGILIGIDLLARPTFSLFTVVLLAIGLDFLTGIIKAKMQKRARTSEGYRKTVVKLMQYVVPILVLYGAGKMIPEHKNLLQQASGYLMMFITYIEVTSIFENLYEIDRRSVVARFLYRPALVLLKFGIENNQVVKAADELEKKKEAGQ